MPDEGPDYTKLFKGLGLILATWVLLLVGFLVVVALVGAAAITRGTGAAALTGVMLTATTWYCVAWTREANRRRAVQPTRSENTGSPSATGWRAVGLPALVSSLAAALGVPLVVAGAIAHLSGLLIAGVTLLVIELLDLAVIWPIRRSRARKRQ